MRFNFFYFLIIFLLALGASFFWLRSSVLANAGFSLVYRITQPFYSFFKDIGLFFSRVFSASEIYQRNIVLEKELQEKDAEILALKDLINNFKLREFGPRSFNGIFARVLIASPEGEVGAIILDKGIQNGVKEGANIITNGGALVGRVIKTYNNFSKAETLVTPNLKIGGQDSRSGVLGLVESSSDGLYFKLLPSSVDISIGDTVITSLENKEFIRGLIIGEITEVIDEGLGTKSAKIKPLFNWAALDQVIISNLPPS